MRLLRVLQVASLYASLLSIISFSGVTATHSLVFSRQANNLNKPGIPQPSAISPRRRLSSRSPTDICASIDTSLLAELEPLVGLSFPDRVSTESYLCACTNDLDFHLDSNTDLTVLADLVGRNTLKSYLKVLIDTASTKQECIRMPVATPMSGACGDGCNIASTTAYTLIAGSCACTYSNTTSDPNKGAPASPQAVASGEVGVKTCSSGVRREIKPVPACQDFEASVESYIECLQLAKAETSKALGADCHQISNVKEVFRTENGCIVNSCAPGWVPSTARHACVRDLKALSLRMTRVRFRDSGSGAATFDFHIIIDLAHLMEALHHLRAHANQLRNNPTALDISAVLTITDEIVQASTELFMSHTVGSFLNHTSRLLNIARRADDKLGECELVDDHDLDGLRADIEVFVQLTADILLWYRNSTGAHALPESTSPDTPITLSLNKLLDDLGLGSVKTLIEVGGLGNTLTGVTNDLLDGLAIGPANERRQLGISTLLEEVKGLLALVLKLGDLGSLLSLKTKSSEKPAMLAPVSLATLGLMTSTNISELSDGLDLLVLAATNARTTLSKYGDCGNLVDELSLVVKTAIAIKTSGGQFSLDQNIDLPFPIPALDPVAPSKPVSAPLEHASTADTLRQPKEEPVIIVLDGLLHHLGLGRVSANMTIGGLGPGLSGTLNDILSLLNAGGRKLARRRGTEVPSAIFSNSELAKAFTTVVEGAIDLESKAAGPGPAATLLGGLMPPVLASLQAVLGSPTVVGLISAVDDLLGAAKEMDKSLIKCECTSVAVLDSSGRFVAAATGIQRWMGEHPDVVRTDGVDEK